MRGKPQVTTRTRVSVPPQGAARLFRGRCRIQRGAPIAGPRRLPSRVRAVSLRSFIGDAVGPLAQTDSENEMTTVVLRSDNATCTAITGLCSGCARIRRIWNFGILQTKNWASWPTSRRRGSTNRTRRLPRVPERSASGGAGVRWCSSTGRAAGTGRRTTGTWTSQSSKTARSSACRTSPLATTRSLARPAPSPGSVCATGPGHRHRDACRGPAPGLRRNRCD